MVASPRLTNSLLHVDQLDHVPARREHLRDAGAHGPGTDHGNALDLHYGNDTLMATALPPPRQSDTRPRRARRLRMAWSSVIKMRAPDAPMGWPSAMAPPLTLNLSGGI